jgi:DNA-binding XRE family transcriptional regulator
MDKTAVTSSELKQWRAAMGITQRAAADALGITRTAYLTMERGVSYVTKKPQPIDRRTELACKYLMMLKNNKPKGRK